MNQDPNAGTAPDLGGLSGGWQVEPERVRAFAAAVSQVRVDLEQLRGAAAELVTDPPLLGTSPIGDGLAAKFTDRAGNEGLHGELTRVIAQLEAFIGSAERTMAEYLERDAAAAQSLRPL
jgi:hypothetical protein